MKVGNNVPLNQRVRMHALQNSATFSVLMVAGPAFARCAPDATVVRQVLTVTQNRHTATFADVAAGFATASTTGSSCSRPSRRRPAATTIARASRRACACGSDRMPGPGGNPRAGRTPWQTHGGCRSFGPASVSFRLGRAVSLHHSACLFVAYHPHAATAKESPVSDPSTPIDYDHLAQAELDLAARAPSRDRRRAHLDQAAIFATLGERQRADRARAEQPVA